MAERLRDGAGAPEAGPLTTWIAVHSDREYLDGTASMAELVDRGPAGEATEIQDVCGRILPLELAWWDAVASAANG
jgi:thiaminase